MKSLLKTTTAALLASTAMANAGGIGRADQSVSIIFETGTYAEFSLAYVDPEVTGIDPTTAATGDMSEAYMMYGGGFKMDYNDKISVGLVFDQPWGADVNYPSGFYTGVTAELNSWALTGVVSYDVTDNIVLFGGLRVQSFEAVASIPIVGGYTVVSDADIGVGYVVGAAYQIPEYALRVALTYNSGINTSHDTLEFGTISTITDVTTPQSINLEFQSGINEKTLIFGSVRWVNWADFTLAPANYPLGILVSYDDDRFTYEIGVGRKFTETLSGALTVTYEATLGGLQSVLSPTDGKLGVGAALIYTMGETEITAGAQYLMLGDINDALGVYEDNTAIAFGLKFARHF